jgi:hypothetical protein
MSQSLQIFSQDAFNITQLFSSLAVIFSQGHIGVEPELCTNVLANYVHMAWLIAVMGIKVEPTRTKA